MQITKFFNNSKELIQKANDIGYKCKRNISAKDEAINRIKFFKHIIEDCDGYKNLYVDGGD